jgi:hypothetical protein
MWGGEQTSHHSPFDDPSLPLHLSLYLSTPRTGGVDTVQEKYSPPFFVGERMESSAWVGILVMWGVGYSCFSRLMWKYICEISCIL